MKKILTTVFVLTILLSQLLAQSDSLEHKFQRERLDFNASYYGETLWYPGLKFGAEYVLFEKSKEKIKHSKRKGDFTKTKRNQFILTGNLGYYWQPHNYGSVLLNFAILYRRTTHKGFQYNLGINPLGINTFFFNETYTVSDEGEVDKAFLSARAFYAPSIIVGLGHTMKKKISAWYLNLHLTGLMPYNNAVNFLIAMEFGFRFNIKKKK